MKTKISKTATLINICISGIVVCLGLYYLVDIVWNGSFVDWFTVRYMNTHEVYSADVKRNILVTEPLWSELKVLILSVLIIIVLVCIITTYVTANLYAKAAVQRHERTLKEETSRKNDLIAYLAHDLKTPLTSVIGYLALLDEAQDMPIEQKTKYVNIALSKALRLEKYINEFFDITRYNLGQINLEKEPINLCHMLVQMTDEFYPLLNAHGNKTEVCVDENMTIYGDSVKLARVFNNILKNAIAYSYQDTIIKIWAENTDKNSLIYFCNKGKTIPAEKLNSIFEKFFRMDEARSTNTGGAGLGLAIAKEIITLHEGKISAESENESTTFCISLPLMNS